MVKLVWGGSVREAIKKISQNTGIAQKGGGAFFVGASYFRKILKGGGGRKGIAKIFGALLKIVDSKVPFKEILFG